MAHLLEVKDLCVNFNTNGETVKAVENVSFYLDAGEIISVVGESGSGKSVTQLGVMQLISAPGEIVGGQVLLEGQDLLQYKPESKEIRRVRGGEISMIFQEPMTSLNPVLTIGFQISEAILSHMDVSKEEARARTIQLLKKLGIPDAETRYGYYPDQFSGGMRQRIMIAMAMSTNPKVLIADEATTALDVTTQAQLLDMLRDIVRETNTALIIVTHNLGIVARYADRIYVMYAGGMVEDGTTKQIFGKPAHPYTRGLIQAIPKLNDEKGRVLIPIDGFLPNLARKPATCVFEPRCPYSCERCRVDGRPPAREVEAGHTSACWLDTAEIDEKEQEILRKIPARPARTSIKDDNILEIQNLSKRFDITRGFFKRKVGTVSALEDVSFSVRRGETLGIVGESGCGKTTLARCILRLYNPEDGTIVFDGEDITHKREKELRNVRKSISMVFQDPFSSMDPRGMARDEIAEPIEVHKLAARGTDTESDVNHYFRVVGLDPLLKYRAPHEFSGGQRQRIGVGRALASQPKMILCDEPISALDVSVQAQIINLLERLQEENNLTYLFIAHDLAVVKHISDRILVMYLGKVVEIAECDELYANALHPYTKMLLSAIPVADPFAEERREKQEIIGEIPSIMNRPKGCPFNNRCARATPACETASPPLIDVGNGHYVACVLYSEPNATVTDTQKSKEDQT